MARYPRTVKAGSSLNSCRADSRASCMPSCRCATVRTRQSRCACGLRAETDAQDPRRERSRRPSGSLKRPVNRRKTDKIEGREHQRQLGISPLVSLVAKACIIPLSNRASEVARVGVNRKVVTFPRNIETLEEVHVHEAIDREQSENSGSESGPVLSVQRTWASSMTLSDQPCCTRRTCHFANQAWASG